MELVHPDYYGAFRCIAGACRHSCCIGWEIDIDSETLARYDAADGELGERLRQSISREGEPHFVLGEGERCPFLNGENLCDLIIGLGEDHLCGICAEHPRFHNALPGRVESGVGLCCEAAGRLILGRQEPAMLEISGEAEVEDDYVLLRDRAISLLQRREESIGARAEQLLALCGAERDERDMEAWCAFFLSLERLEEGWTALLSELGAAWSTLDLDGFDRYMAGRQTEYEQLLVYFVYRHLANAVGEADLAARAGFAVLGYRMIRALGAMLWQRTGAFSFDDQVELGRIFSAEIEYSEENMELLLDELC